jgi:hypothetical protein
MHVNRVLSLIRSLLCVVNVWCVVCLCVCFSVQCKSELVQRFGTLIRKIWSPYLFRNHVSPHELLQVPHTLTILSSLSSPLFIHYLVLFVIYACVYVRKLHSEVQRSLSWEAKAIPSSF